MSCFLNAALECKRHTYPKVANGLASPDPDIMLFSHCQHQHKDSICAKPPLNASLHELGKAGLATGANLAFFSKPYPTRQRHNARTEKVKTLILGNWSQINYENLSPFPFSRVPALSARPETWANTERDGGTCKVGENRWIQTLERRSGSRYIWKLNEIGNEGVAHLQKMVLGFYHGILYMCHGYSMVYYTLKYFKEPCKYHGKNNSSHWVCLHAHCL